MTRKLYHNPRCSKSRAAAELLRDSGVEFETIEYLKQPPTAQELKRIVSLLGIKPADLVRRGEKLFKELGLGDQTLTDDQWIKTMVEHPKLIERPILVTEQGAAIGRPIENIQELI